MSETNLLRRIQLAIGSKPDYRVFRNQVGVGFVGKPPNLTRVSMGLCPGSGDLIGWVTRVIQPDDIGKDVAVFLSLEVKTDKGRVSDGQSKWLDAVRNYGGIAAIVRSEEEAFHAIRSWTPLA